MPEIAAVLFDLDETLLDRAASLSAFLKDQYQRFAAHLGRVDCDAWCGRFVALDNRGYVHKSIVYPAILGAFGGAGDLSDALLKDYRERSCLHARAMPGMKETLLALRARAEVGNCDQRRNGFSNPQHPRIRFA